MWWILYAIVAIPIAYLYARFWAREHKPQYYQLAPLHNVFHKLVNCIVFGVAFVLAPIAVIDLVVDKLNRDKETKSRRTI